MAIPKKIVQAVLERDHYMCQLQLTGCIGEASCADHRCGRGHGGSRVLNLPSNLVAACGLCNGAKESATGAVRERLLSQGLLLLKAATNDHSALRARLTPVTRVDGVLVFLNDDGTVTEAS